MWVNKKLVEVISSRLHYKCAISWYSTSHIRAKTDFIPRSITKVCLLHCTSEAFQDVSLEVREKGTSLIQKASLQAEGSVCSHFCSETAYRALS